MGAYLGVDVDAAGGCREDVQAEEESLEEEDHGAASSSCLVAFREEEAACETDAAERAHRGRRGLLVSLVVGELGHAAPAHELVVVGGSVVVAFASS